MDETAAADHIQEAAAVIKQAVNTVAVSRLRP